ncbi:hypothetical protein CDAR_305301 [Caerostris darwini]|uniref:Uncharacterized protein n=1 Tax=Caerostris darwini TaxID=1538125 RepID=A0AAV4MBQ6_9ARAC|nr:hypothetical protein CDAR_305301 [Caerostris darwini]
MWRSPGIATKQLLKSLNELSCSAYEDLLQDGLCASSFKEILSSKEVSDSMEAELQLARSPIGGGVISRLMDRGFIRDNIRIASDPLRGIRLSTGFNKSWCGFSINSLPNGLI